MNLFNLALFKISKSGYVLPKATIMNKKQKVYYTFETGVRVTKVKTDIIVFKGLFSIEKSSWREIGIEMLEESQPS